MSLSPDRTPPAAVPHELRKQAGRTSIEHTPLEVRFDGVEADEAVEKVVREAMGRKLGRFAAHIERMVVRFIDINGPKGGIDVACRVHLVLSNLTPVQTEEKGADPLVTARGAIAAAARQLKHQIDRKQWHTPPLHDGITEAANAEGGEQASEEQEAAAVPAGEGDAGVPAEATGTGTRNVMENTERSVSAFEDSAPGKRPSRKSTRRGLHGGKQDDKKRLTASLELNSPQWRAERARVGSLKKGH